MTQPNQKLLQDLARAKVLFQQRTILTVMEVDQKAVERNAKATKEG